MGERKQNKTHSTHWREKYFVSCIILLEQLSSDGCVCIVERMLFIYFCCATLVFIVLEFRFQQ